MNAVSHSSAAHDAAIYISEIFGPTVQGEGAMIGTQTVFVRTGGCDYRCSWCDTGYAVLPKYENDWQAMTAHAIMERIETLSKQQPLWITLSGGNPATQPLESLITLGHAKGYRFSMETQASIAKPWFAQLDQLTLSPKPPSSGMAFKQRGLERCLAACDTLENLCLKFVIADIDDLLWAKALAEQYPQLPCYVQPCNTEANIEHESKAEITLDQQQQMRWLIDQVQQLNWHKARILPQLHTWLWGNQSGV